MIDAVYNADWFTHLLASLILLSRLGDIVSTRLVTPTLRLEANSIVRRFGWWFAGATVLVALVPYYNAPIGVSILTVSLFVTSSNLGRGWWARALGEAECEALLIRAASRGRRSTALGFVLTAAAHMIFAGVFLMWLSGSAATWTFWFAFGVVGYGFVIGVHGSSFVLRIFNRAAQPASV